MELSQEFSSQNAEIRKSESSQNSSIRKNGKLQQAYKNQIQVTGNTKNSITNHRARSRKDSTSSESEASVLNSEEEDGSIRPKEQFNFTIVTQDVYDKHAAEIRNISAKIQQNQALLKFSSQLKDRGDKVKKLMIQLHEDLADKQSIIKHLKLKETTDLTDELKKMSVKDRENWETKWHRLSCEFQSTADMVSSRVANLLQDMHKSLKTMPNEHILADQPSLINVSLMSHRRRALAWMEWREKEFPKGGILADDMGLGKTLTMISLIARQMERRKPKSQQEQKENSRHMKPEYNGRTLIVCPASLITQWKSEIDKYTNFGSVMLHHGNKRSTSATELTSHEIVITTYGIVKVEFDKAGPISKINWERIILDEAHTVRNHTSKQSQDCCRLNGSIKWCLSGTPIHNKEQDVFALLKFIGCAPLDDYATFKQFTATNKRLHLILKFVLLRRTKQELQTNVGMLTLPLKSTEIVQVKLDDHEMDVYRIVLEFSQSLLRKFLADQREEVTDFLIDEKHSRMGSRYLQKFFNVHLDTDSISVSHICLPILRLRQICIHPNLIDAMLSAEDLKISSDQSALESPTQLKQLGELKISEAIDNDENVASILSRSNSVFSPDIISSKFKAVLNLISDRVIKTGEKAVVVSQFTSVLKLFAKHLSDQKVRYLMLTGSTKISHRTDIVNNFNNNSNEQILLLSLTAGGVGLNLCGGNHLFLIDPHWNPQLESQAEDRVYRIGQKKPVTIYSCQQTIEEIIVDLQVRKRQIAKSVLDEAGKGFEMKLTVEDMWNLIK